MSGGTFNVSRDLWDDAAFADEPFSEREAWLWMLSEASWKPRERRVGKAVVQTQRGQLAGSMRFMAEAWKWSKSRVHRFLKRLEGRDMIRTESGTGVVVITLCKYEEYQGSPKSSGTAAGQQRDSSGTNEKKGKEGERRKEEYPVAAGAAQPDEAVSAYNDAAERTGWPKVQKLTTARRTAVQRRLAECGGIDGWKAVVSRAEASDFLAGRTSHAWGGFGFDWLTKQANFTKLTEGNYDNRAPSQSSSPHLKSIPGGRHDRRQFDQAHREYTRRLAAGEIHRGPDPSDPFAGG